MHGFHISPIHNNCSTEIWFIGVFIVIVTLTQPKHLGWRVAVRNFLTDTLSEYFPQPQKAKSTPTVFNIGIFPYFSCTLRLHIFLFSFHLSDSFVFLISHYFPSVSLSLSVFASLDLIAPALPEEPAGVGCFPPPALLFFLHSFWPYYRFMLTVCSLNRGVKSRRVRSVWFTHWVTERSSLPACQRLQGRATLPACNYLH